MQNDGVETAIAGPDVSLLSMGEVIDKSIVYANGRRRR
jgi:hypothetical protein